jgi:hypothetical protein
MCSLCFVTETAWRVVLETPYGKFGGSDARTDLVGGGGKVGDASCAFVSRVLQYLPGSPAILKSYLRRSEQPVPLDNPTKTWSPSFLRLRVSSGFQFAFECNVPENLELLEANIQIRDALEGSKTPIPYSTLHANPELKHIGANTRCYEASRSSHIS